MTCIYIYTCVRHDNDNDDMLRAPFKRYSERLRRLFVDRLRPSPAAARNSEISGIFAMTTAVNSSPIVTLFSNTGAKFIAAHNARVFFFFSIRRGRESGPSSRRRTRYRVVGFGRHSILSLFFFHEDFHEERNIVANFADETLERTFDFYRRRRPRSASPKTRNTRHCVPPRVSDANTTANRDDILSCDRVPHKTCAFAPFRLLRKSPVRPALFENQRRIRRIRSVEGTRQFLNAVFFFFFRYFSRRFPKPCILLQ